MPTARLFRQSLNALCYAWLRFGARCGRDGSALQISQLPATPASVPDAEVPWAVVSSPVRRARALPITPAVIQLRAAYRPRLMDPDLWLRR
jgi:hypothetical protein